MEIRFLARSFEKQLGGALSRKHRLVAFDLPGHGEGLTKSDAGAIADYLKSLPPVSHEVQGPFGPGNNSPLPRMMVVFPAGNGADTANTSHDERTQLDGKAQQQ
jgi:hypothetical protein